MKTTTLKNKTQSQQKLLSDNDQSISSFDESENVQTKVQVDIHRQEDLSIENKTYILDKFLNDSSHDQDPIEISTPIKAPIPKPRKNHSQEKGQGDNNDKVKRKVKYDSDKDTNTKNSSSTPNKTSSDEIVVGKSDSGSYETFIFEKPQPKKRTRKNDTSTSTKVQHEIENIKKRNNDEIEGDKQGKNEMVDELKLKIAKRNENSSEKHIKHAREVTEKKSKLKRQEDPDIVINVNRDEDFSPVNLKFNRKSMKKDKSDHSEADDIKDASDNEVEETKADEFMSKIVKESRKQFENDPKYVEIKNGSRKSKRNKETAEEIELKTKNDLKTSSKENDLKTLSKVNDLKRTAKENYLKPLEEEIDLETFRKRSNNSTRKKVTVGRVNKKLSSEESEEESSKNTSDDERDDKVKKKALKPLKFQALKYSFKKQMSKMLLGDDETKVKDSADSKIKEASKMKDSAASKIIDSATSKIIDSAASKINDSEITKIKDSTASKIKDSTESKIKNTSELKIQDSEALNVQNASESTLKASKSSKNIRKRTAKRQSKLKQSLVSTDSENETSENKTVSENSSDIEIDEQNINESSDNENEVKKETTFDIFRAKSANKTRKGAKTESKENLIDSESKNRSKKKSITLKLLRDKFKKKISNIANDETAKKQLETENDQVKGYLGIDSDEIKGKRRNLEMDDRIKGKNKSKQWNLKTDDDKIKSKKDQDFNTDDDKANRKNKKETRDVTKSGKAKENVELKIGKSKKINQQKRNMENESKSEGEEQQNIDRTNISIKKGITINMNEVNKKTKKLQVINDALSEVDEIESITEKNDDSFKPKNQSSKLKKQNIIKIFSKPKESVKNENIEMQNLSVFKKQKEKIISSDEEKQKHKTNKMYDEPESSDTEKRNQKTTKIYEEMVSSNENDEKSSGENEAKALRFRRMKMPNKNALRKSKNRQKSTNEETDNENETRPKSSQKVLKNNKEMKSENKVKLKTKNFSKNISEETESENEAKIKTQGPKNTSEMESDTSEENESENEAKIKSKRRKSFRKHITDEMESGNESIKKLQRPKSSIEEMESENEVKRKSQRPKSSRKNIIEETESENDEKIKSQGATSSKKNISEETESDNDAKKKSQRPKNIIEETESENEIKKTLKSYQKASRKEKDNLNVETESENEFFTFRNEKQTQKSSRKHNKEIKSENETEKKSQRPKSSRKNIKEEIESENERKLKSQRAKSSRKNTNEETESENETKINRSKLKHLQKSEEKENDKNKNVTVTHVNEKSKKHRKTSEDDEEDYASSDNKTKKHNKSRRKKRSTKEETSLTNYTYEKITRIMIHRTDRLLLDSYVIHPVVKIHIIDSETGDYIKKSDKKRNVLFYNERQEIDYIGAVMTQAYGLREHRSLHPNWEEAIIINDDIQYISDNQSLIIIFEIMDFLSMNVIKETNQKGQLGWHKIAWAFIKPTTPVFSNIGKKLRLQLYYPSTSKKTTADHCDVYHWWRKQRFKKYPSTIYVTIDGIISPDTVIETLRSKAPNEVERGRSTLGDYGNIVPNNDDVIKDEGVKEETTLLEKRLWSRQENQLCKVPNKCIAKLDSYDDGCFCMKFSNDGLFLACGVMEEGAFLIVVYTVLENRHVSTLPGHQGLIYEIVWTKNDKMLLSASADCTVCIWDMETYKFIQTLPHPSFIYSTVIFENTIITGCFDGCIRVWLIDRHMDYELIEELNGHEGYVTSLCCNVNGTLLYSSDSIGVVNIWKFNGKNWILRKDIKILDLKAVVINQLVLHKKERRLLVNSRDSKIRLVDIKTGYVLQTYNGALNNRVHITCSFTPCGTYVISGSENGELHFWNAENGMSEQTLKPYNHNMVLHCTQFHPKDNILAISHYGNNLPILIYKYVRDSDEKSTRTLIGAVGSVLNRKRAYSEHMDGSMISFKDVLEKMDNLIGYK